MNDSHPMLLWAEEKGITVEELAETGQCSAAHLRNIFAGRKEASLRLASRLSAISGGAVPMQAFLKSVEARA